VLCERWICCCAGILGSASSIFVRFAAKVGAAAAAYAQRIDGTDHSRQQTGNLTAEPRVSFAGTPCV
jgi:hypothetical protein